MSYAGKLEHYYPAAKWTLDGETYAGLNWLDDAPKPSKATLDALVWPVAAPPVRLSPTLFAAVTINITNGVLASIELAAQLQGAFYDDGWLFIGFADEQDPSNYMVFAQTDIPAKIEQYKDTGSFELIFSDANGDPAEPAQVNVQILKVR